MKFCTLDQTVIIVQVSSNKLVYIFSDDTILLLVLYSSLYTFCCSEFCVRITMPPPPPPPKKSSKPSVAAQHQQPYPPSFPPPPLQSTHFPAPQIQQASPVPHHFKPPPPIQEPPPVIQTLSIVEAPKVLPEPAAILSEVVLDVSEEVPGDGDKKEDTPPVTAKTYNDAFDEEYKRPSVSYHCVFKLLLNLSLSLSSLILISSLLRNPVLSLLQR